MTRELFVDFCEYFIRSMENAGYGRKHGRNMVLLLDGHTSRWSWYCLQLLIKHGFFPFCIGSHTSAWDQPNDNGPNATFKAILGRCIHEWRMLHPFCVFDRSAFNQCVVKAVHKMKFKLAADMATWTAKKNAWLKASAEMNEDLPLDPPPFDGPEELPDQLPPLVGKPGNCVTRAWERTGWWPLKRESSNWQAVIPTLGSRYEKKTEKTVYKMLDLGEQTKHLQIRQLAWDGYNDNFLDMAKSLSEAHKQKSARRNTSVVDTRTGRGFSCAADIQFLKEYEQKKLQEEQVIIHTRTHHSHTSFPHTSFTHP